MQTHEQPQPAQSGAAEHVDVLVVGAGQAGLALGWHLRQQGLTSFLLVDAGPEVGHVWRTRWDSLRLFTPAEYDGLPGVAFPAAAGTYPTKDQVADYLRGYAAAFELPVRLNTRVHRITKVGEMFLAVTSTGVLTARQVVIATGPFQTPVIPGLSRDLDLEVVQVHSADYRSPAQLPDGPVLVVGAGNSGLQIACELAATRPVTVAVGTRPPMLPQRFLGRDLFWWLTRLGVITKTADSRLARRLRKRGDLVIGTRWRDLARLGIQVRPRLESICGRTASFADEGSTDVAAVVWATGYRTDYSWLEVPGAVVDDAVVNERGVTPVPGLSILGLPWLHTRGSALLGFVKDDAAWLASHVSRELTTAVSGTPADAAALTPGLVGRAGRGR
jgi:putative flavoprotein involved in K+ transport